jgi:hypothetical protein
MEKSVGDTSISEFSNLLMQMSPHDLQAYRQVLANKLLFVEKKMRILDYYEYFK